MFYGEKYFFKKLITKYLGSFLKTKGLGLHKTPLFIFVPYSSLTVAVVNKVKNTIVKNFNILTPIFDYTAKDSPQPHDAVAFGFDTLRKLPPNSVT